MKTHRAFYFLLLAALLAGCGGKATPAPTMTEAATETETATVVPTAASTPTTAPTATATAVPKGIIYLNPQKYEVEYDVNASNTGYNVSRLLVYQPKPVEWDAQKDVTIESVSPAPTHETLDPVTGSGMYSWDLSSMPKSGEDLRFALKFTFTAYETHTALTADDVKPYNTSDPIYKQFTTAERFIESNDPQIKAKATEIAAGETNPLLVTRKFYDYIIDHATYSLTGTGLKGAKSLLTSGKGECGDYSSLFIALSRASGIPARAVVGYWADSGLDQTHVWAEFYLEGYGWVPVDATIGQKPGKRDYYFGNMDNERMILNRGFNITLLPATPNNYVAPFLQVPAWFYWGSGNQNALTLNRFLWDVTQIK